MDPFAPIDPMALDATANIDSVLDEFLDGEGDGLMMVSSGAGAEELDYLPAPTARTGMDELVAAPVDLRSAKAVLASASSEELAELAARAHLVPPKPKQGRSSEELLVRTAEAMRAAASKRWLRSDEALDVLENATTIYGIECEVAPARRPGSGSLLLFSRIEHRSFRVDGHEWRVKKDGKQLDESHAKLKSHALDAEFRLLISSLHASTPPSPLDGPSTLLFAPRPEPQDSLGGSSAALSSAALSSAAFSSTFTSASNSRPPSSASSRSLSSHLELLDWPSEDVNWPHDADRRLRRLQQHVRNRLRHNKSMPRGGSANSAPLPFARRVSREARDGGKAPSGQAQGEVEAAVSQVQRVFRSRRQDSRRRAALAIERFYLRRRRSPACARPPGSGGASPSQGASAPHPSLSAHLSVSSAIASPRILAAAGLPPQPLAPLPEAAPLCPGATAAEEVRRGGAPMGGGGLGAGPLGGGAALGASPRAAALGSHPWSLGSRAAGHSPNRSPGGTALGPPASGSTLSASPLSASPGSPSTGLSEEHIRHAQLAFRTRQQHRKRAVRVIESAWSEWQYHSEQAKIAACAPDAAPYHAYHAERRERAARVIQGYLQRQQAEIVAPHAFDDAMDAMGGGDAALLAGSAADDHQLYSAAELELLRRVQGRFRAHVRHQAAEAEAALQATRSATHDVGGVGPAYERLCEILRRCNLEGGGANLSADEHGMLKTLQLAVRNHLERKRQLPTQPHEPNTDGVDSGGRAAWPNM